jgi:hypothetical protein
VQSNQQSDETIMFNLVYALKSRAGQAKSSAEDEVSQSDEHDNLTLAARIESMR